MAVLNFTTARLSALGMLTLAMACGGPNQPDNQPGDEPGNEPESPGPATGEGLTHTFESLDVTSLGAQSANWCAVPAFTPGGFVALDKAAFRDILADYTVSWMTPVHEGIEGIDEASLFNATFELIWSTFLTDCNWNTPEDLLLGDDGLLDPQNRADARQEVSDFIEAGVELSNGETLRMAFHQCPTCTEPLGAQPFFVNAQLTNDGVLVLGIELFEGQPFTRTLLLTPDAAVLQADLAAFTTWTAQISDETRSGEILMPGATGMVTGVARKDNLGGISGTLGISGFSLNSEPGTADDVQIVGDESCIGMHLGVSAPTGEAQLAAHLGSVTTSIPGHVNCNTDACDTAETDNAWIYELGGLSLTAAQPENGSEEDLSLSIATETASRARVGENVFAQGGLGAQGNGGSVSLDVNNGTDGFLVTFKPALKLAGALAISSFSERFKVDLPDWLADEIFDITLGGETTAQLFVPARLSCNNFDLNPEGMDPPEPARREVEVREGTLEASVGSGVKSAATGQCVGKTLLPETSLTLTSDWVETGFACTTALP